MEEDVASCRRGKCGVNEAGTCKKTRGGLSAKAVECCPAKLVSIPASDTQVLCDVEQLNANGHSFVVFISWVLHMRSKSLT